MRIAQFSVESAKCYNSSVPNEAFFAVVIPTLNRGRRLVSAVRSVLAQTENSLECWVVDGGSTDDTRDRIERLPDERLRCVWNEKRIGVWCRNQAIQRTRAPWIAFIDDDDAWLPGHLAEIRSAIASRPRTGFWFTNAYVHRYGRIIGTLFDPERPIPEGRVPGQYAVGDRHLPYVTSCLAIRRDAFEATGFFRDDMSWLEDTELYARMLRDGLEVGVIRKPTFVRFIHDAQLTQLHYDDRFLASLDAAIRAGAPPPDEELSLRRQICLQVAVHLLKSGRPDAARRFLDENCGPEGKRLSLRAWTMAPQALLKAGKLLRRWWLRARYGPPWAPAEYSRALAAIRPYFEGDV